MGKVLVTGAAGQLGRQALDRLLAQGVRDLVAGTRNPASLAAYEARGVELRSLDFDDPASLSRGFVGVERALLISTDALDRPGRRLEQHERAVAAAARAGVDHVVYTSLVNPGPDSAVSIAPDHRGTEEALAKAGVGYTVLRNNLYTDLLLGGLDQTLASGALYTGRGAGAVGYVTREDCAAAAAAALASAFRGQRIVDVTGPAALTGDDLAAAISAATGRHVKHVPLPPSAYGEALRGAGLPAPVVDLLVSFEVAAGKGQLAVVSSAVATLTGRPPTSVEAFLRASRR